MQKAVCLICLCYVIRVSGFSQDGPLDSLQDSLEHYKESLIFRPTGICMWLEKRYG